MGLGFKGTLGLGFRVGFEVVVGDFASDVSGSGEVSETWGSFSL